MGNTVIVILVTAGIVCGIIAALYSTAKALGKQGAKTARFEGDLKDASRAAKGKQKIKKEINEMSPDDVDASLTKHGWMRDDEK